VPPPATTQLLLIESAARLHPRTIYKRACSGRPRTAKSPLSGVQALVRLLLWMGRRARIERRAGTKEPKTDVGHEGASAA
jgi:hypothetical protein